MKPEVICSEILQWNFDQRLGAGYVIKTIKKIEAESQKQTEEEFEDEAFENRIEKRCKEWEEVLSEEKLLKW